MSTKAELFSNAPKLSGNLDEVPGLADKGISNLKSKGIHTTYQLFGKFLDLDRNPEKLHAWLCSPEIGGHAASLKTQKTAERIAARVLGKGFTCDIKLSDHVIKSTLSKFGDDKKTAFMMKKLSGDLASDFFGIKTTSGFTKAGITNTDKLFASFLSIIDNPFPGANVAKCDEFYGKLSKLGAASGFKSIIIYQLQAKLAVGIDSEGKGLDYCPVLDAVPEDTVDEEAYDRGERSPCGTDEKTRVKTRVASEPKREAEPKKLFADPSFKSPAPKKEDPSMLMYAVPVVLAAAIYAYLYWPSSSTELASTAATW